MIFRVKVVRTQISEAEIYVKTSLPLAAPDFEEKVRALYHEKPTAFHWLRSVSEKVSVSGVDQIIPHEVG